MSAPEKEVLLNGEDADKKSIASVEATTTAAQEAPTSVTGQAQNSQAQSPQSVPVGGVQNGMVQRQRPDQFQVSPRF